MKKIIGIIFISLTFCNISFAEIKVIENKKIMMGIAPRWVTTMCVDDYKFVVFRDGVGISMVQFFENENNSRVGPAKC
jgi:hypothetical protein